MVRTEALRLYQGDSYVNTVNVSDQGQPANLTGWTATAQIRTDVAELAPGPPTATFTTTIDPVDHNIIHLRLDPVTAANLPDGPLVWDLQVTDGVDVFTLLRGPVYVGKQITA
jgi:hypothetical protein